MLCRTLEQIEEAARRDAAADPPLSQETADQVAVILAPWHARQAQAA